MDKVKIWLKGLLAAIVGGAAISGTAALNDPTLLSSQEGWNRLGIAALSGGAVGLCGYLAKSPLK